MPPESSRGQSFDTSLTPNLYIVSVDNGEAVAEPPSLKRPRRLARPRTPPFHGDNMGSNPIGDTSKHAGFIRIRLCRCFLVTMKSSPSALISAESPGELLR